MRLLCVLARLSFCHSDKNSSPHAVRPSFARKWRRMPRNRPWPPPRGHKLAWFSQRQGRRMDLVALFGISSYFLLSAFFLARTSLLYCAVNRRLTRSPVNTPHRWRLVTPNALASSQIPCNLRLTGGVVTRNMDVVWQIFRKSSTECFKKRQKGEYPLTTRKNICRRN